MQEKDKDINFPLDEEYENFDGENDKSPPTNKKEYTKYSINEKKMPKLIRSHNKYQNIKKEDKMKIEIEESISEKDSVESKIKAISFKINKIDNRIEDIEKDIDKNTTKFWGVKILEEKIGLLEERNRLEEEKKTLILIKESQEENIDLSDDKIEVSKFPNIKGNKKTKRINAENNTQINEEITKYATNADITTKYSNFLKNPVILKYFFDTLLYTLINIIDFINKRANSKYKIELEDISKRDEFDINKDNFRDILNGNVYDIYIGIHWKKNIKEHFEDYEKIKKQINSLIEEEENNAKDKLKLLSILFYSNVKVLYKNCLENNHYIKVNISELYLGIQTVDKFKDFNEELNNRVKEYISSSETSLPVGETIIYDPLINIQELLEQKYNNIQKIIKIPFYIRRSILAKCIKSIHFLISNIYKNYQSNALHILNMKNQIGNSFEKYRIFFKKILKSIYEYMKPKRVINKYIKYTYNINQINKALEKEKKEEKSILNDVMEVKFEIYLILFLTDTKKIYKIDENGNIKDEIYLDGFKTYKDYFSKKYTKDVNDAYIKDMLEIINGKKGRKSSDKRNTQLKGKKYNKRNTK